MSLNNFGYLLNSILFFLLSFFLSFLSSLYGNIDFFKLNLIEIEKNRKNKIDKLIFILENINILNFSSLLIQHLINHSFSSSIGIFDNIINPEFKSEKGLFFLFINNFFKLFAFLFSFLILLITEKLSDYILSKNETKYLIMNNIFLNISFFVVKMSFYLGLGLVIKRKKIFSYNEEDIIRFIRNLSSKSILLLESKEAKLIESALELDDINIGNIFVKEKNVIYLSEEDNLDKVMDIYKKSKFSKIPVEREGKTIGIMTLKNLVLGNDVKKIENFNWENFIESDFCSLEVETRLDKALEKLKRSKIKLGIVLDKNKKEIGIVTLEDILSQLVGNFDRNEN